MKPERLMKYFDELADKTGIRIIRGKGDFHGGPCIVNKENIIVVNKVKPVEQQLRILAEEFAGRDLGDVYIVPALRRYINEVGGSAKLD